MAGMGWQVWPLQKLSGLEHMIQTVRSAERDGKKTLPIADDTNHLLGPAKILCRSSFPKSHPNICHLFFGE